MLSEFGEDAKVLAGGQSLIPLLKLRFANPSHLVDLNFIPGMSYIKEEDGRLRPFLSFRITEALVCSSLF